MRHSTTLAPALSLALIACGGPERDVAPAEPTAIVQTLQRQPRCNLDGLYRMACQQTKINLHGTFNGRAGAVDLALPCTGMSAEQQEEARAEIAARCQGSGWPASLCDVIARGLVQTASDLTRAALGILPETIQMTVDWGSWLGRLFGVYPARLVHRTAAGQEVTLSYLVNTNEGPQRVSLATVGLRVEGARAIPGLACTDVSTGSARGKILCGGAEQTMDLKLLLSRDLVCVAAVQGQSATFSLGAAYTGDLTGSKE